MRVGDKQLGAPYVQFTGTKAQIEALSNVEVGAVAVATDNPTAPLGVYNGSAWVWGGGGGGAAAWGDITGTLSNQSDLQTALNGKYNSADHTKAAHDALGIDADTLDGSHASAFAPSSHNHAWGTITGTLSDQTDLQSALDGKAEKGTPVFQRILRSDIALADGDCLFVARYIDLNGHDLVMPEGGDCEIAII